MRRTALVFTAPYQVDVRDEAQPPPGPDQVLVQIHLSAISAGTELLVYRGLVPPDLALDETIGALGGRFAFPLRYGYAAVGEVVECGRDVSAAWLGRRVFAFQPHASHFLAAPAELHPVDLPPRDAVCLPTLETAVNLLLDGAPLLGERVAVFGQGVVGLLTTALLARLPLAHLATLDPRPARRAWSLDLGARASLDPTAPGGMADLLERLGPERADLVYELSGEPRALDQAIAATGYAGRVVVGAWYGRKPVTLDLGSHFHRGKIRLIASQVSRIAPELSGRWTASRRLDLARHLLADLRPGRLVTHEFPIARAADAYRLLDERPAEALQVVLTYPS